MTISGNILRKEFYGIYGRETDENVTVYSNLDVKVDFKQGS